MLRAGWDPHGYLELFARLDELEKASGKERNPFLSDHPPTPERAAAIRHELTLVTVPKGAKTNSITFTAFKTALKFLPEPPKKPEAEEPKKTGQ
jgi:predicted Zn-dependent protease